MDLSAIVLAAGRGERLGADKAHVELGGATAIERVCAHLRELACDEVIVVRRQGAAPLPTGLDVERIDCDTDAMLETLRAAWRARRSTLRARVLVFPIDYAMVRADTLRTLLTGAAPITLPLCRGRVGHPLVLAREVLAEIDDPAVQSLRDVIRREPSRVGVVEVEDGFVLRDIDTPADLLAARGVLANAVPATELLARHRSRRAWRDEPVGDAQLRWLVDSARRSATSSFIQAASVVAVRDRATKERIAALCSDQPQIREAPVFLAIVADLRRIACACERSSRRMNADTLEVFVEATIDATIVGQSLALAAESEGLGTCMIGAARNHPRDLAALLGLPRHAWVVFGMALGWPADDPLPRERLPLDAVLHDERYDDTRTDAALAAADEALRAWARRSNERASPGTRRIDEARGWSDRMAFLFGGDRPHKGRQNLGPELREMGFLLDGVSGRDSCGGIEGS